MESRITRITLGVADMSRAIRFYNEGLGFSLNEINEYSATFHMEGTVLALIPWEILADEASVNNEGDGFAGFILSHYVNSHDEVHRIIRDAESAGGYVPKRATIKSDGGYSGYFSDMDGYVWEVAFYPNV
jgi:predicted lactoylglutathione lyase